MKTKKITKTIIASVAILAMFVAISVKDDIKGEVAIRAISTISFIVAILIYEVINNKEDKQ